MKVENLQTRQQSRELANSSAPLHPRKGIFFYFMAQLTQLTTLKICFVAKLPAFILSLHTSGLELQSSIFLCVCLIIAS